MLSGFLLPLVGKRGARKRRTKHGFIFKGTSFQGYYLIELISLLLDCPKQPVSSESLLQSCLLQCLQCFLKKQLGKMRGPKLSSTKSSLLKEELHLGNPANTEQATRIPSVWIWNLVSPKRLRTVVHCSRIPPTCSHGLEEIKDTLEKWGPSSGSETRALPEVQLVCLIRRLVFCWHTAWCGYPHQQVTRISQLFESHGASVFL